MAVQGAQKNDRTARVSYIGIFVMYIIVYISTSFTMMFALSSVVNSYLMACFLSFSSIGVTSYLGMHFLLPSEMSRIDTRLLHELAKRKLVEFRPIGEDPNVVE